jgi:hypothetical protein
LSTALAQAKGYLGYAGQAATIGAQVAQLGTAAVAGVGAVIGVVTGALGLASGLTAEAKTGVAEVAKQDQIVSSGAALASAVATAAALAVSIATAAVTGLLLLPATLFFSIQSINDQKNAVWQAKKDVKAYQNATKDIHDWVPLSVSISDKLDEAHLLPRVKQADQITWLQTQYLLSCQVFYGGSAVSVAFDHLRNGEKMAGIPGRDMTTLANMYANAVRDSWIMFFLTRDLLVRLKVPIPPIPTAGITRNGDEIGLTITWDRAQAEWCGITPADAGGAAVSPASAGFGIVTTNTLFQPTGNPATGTNEGAVSIAPSLQKILNRERIADGNSFEAFMMFWKTANINAWMASDMFARINQSAALETLDAVAPPIVQSVEYPHPEQVQTEIALLAQSARATIQIQQAAESLRVELLYEQQSSNAP